jgi:thioredoxin 1
MTTGIGLNCNHTGASTNRPRLANEKEIVNSNFMELNETNFDREVLNAMQPVLVEFWADWSEPCKAMAAILESVAKDDAVAVKIATVNVERHENLTDQCGVRAVPTLLIFNQGALQDQIIGGATEQGVRERLERLKLISESQIQRNPQPHPVGATGAP